jgi:glutamate formiminotransferase/formiminotetrahydrofolate cyclodeaminase
LFGIYSKNYSLMKQLLECVPNFSEGQDKNIISQITQIIESVEGVILLNVDPGKATNRTVVTFVGEPKPVMEAAFRATRKAMELIDMTRHKGEHPRFGATDVLPLIPVSGITMEETIALARQLAERIGTELGIPVYCYEFASFTESRRNLASVRSGEYEGLAEKLSKPEWQPDFGPAEFLPRTGSIAVGARDFLIAYNVNLNTTSARRANAVAFDIRERGRMKREGNPAKGKLIKDDKGVPVYIPGSLKAVKAIGWYIEEFGIAQISINLTNINITPIHIAFDEACRKADLRGLRVTGSEIVGMVPLKAMLDAGRYFLEKQQRSTGISDEEILKIAIKSLGLNDLYPFRPEEKIIEYAILKANEKKLTDYSVIAFCNETASESPAPGGGSVSALMAALGVSLGMMVANISAHKRGWEDRWLEFSHWAEKGKLLQKELIFLINEDTRAFNKVVDAFALPKKKDEEIKRRSQAVQSATRYAIEIPLKVMKTSLQCFDLIKAMVETGNPNSLSDAGVGALALRSGIMGALLNVKINASSLDDKTFASEVLHEASQIERKALQFEREILENLSNKLV